MKEMKQYKKPTAEEIDLTPYGILATSDLKYSEESADKNSEVLSGKHRGEWGDMWK